MPSYPIYQIDAFASQAFEGNQAGVMPLEAGFLPDDVMQAIAAENNVAETAFIVPQGEGVWALRWFTPTVEVPLCGHATLASAYVLYEHLGFQGDEIIFETRHSGALRVRKESGGYLQMDFPASPIQEIEVTDDVVAALGARPVRAWGGSFYAAMFESVDAVQSLVPDLKALSKIGTAGDQWARGNFGCFALGGEESADVTSRFFAPGSGIDEDPATGSWHCMLTSVASSLLEKPALKCRQAFPGRGAWIGTELAGDRVKLRGQAVTVIEGVMTL
jgi:PhzF family phenazine biosynthesis protein